MCAEEIEAAAKTCPFCGTEFEITIRGYCTHDHGVEEADQDGKCLKCGTEVMDRQVESRVKERPAAGPTAGPVPVPPPPAPAPVVPAWAAPPQAPAPARILEVFEQKGEDPGVRFIASWFDQIMIALIDIPIILVTALLYLGGISKLADPGSLPLLFFVFILLADFTVWVLYFSIQEGLFGTTLGKIVGVWPLRLKVIRKDGQKLGFGRALLRAVIGFFETNLIGAIVIWSTSMHQRLGDLAAGTLVVDAAKIRRAEFGPQSAVIEFLDGRKKEMVQMTKGVISKWLGIPRWMIVEGLDPGGRKIKFRAKITRGATVFSTESRVGQLRLALESAFHFPFKETVEWWRIALLAGILLLAVVCIGLGAYSGSILPSLNIPDWFAPAPKTATFDSLRIYPTGTRVTIDGYLYLPGQVRCDTECSVCLSREANGSCDLRIFIRVGSSSPASPNRMDPLPSIYKTSDFRVTTDDGRRITNNSHVRITGRVCETTLGNQCIDSITEILYRP